MIEIFFSYSHADEVLRDELEKHLSILKRQGVISTWHDRRITSGSELDSSINGNLEKADVVLLLVSPDFLASDYCYDIEMGRAMERHDTTEAKVIPVILRSCDWYDAPFGKLLATPTDGKPVTKFPTLDDGFLEVTKAIKNAIKELPNATQDKQVSVDVPEAINLLPEKPRSSNLRIITEFTDQQKDQFMDDAFEYMANFFEGSLDELDKRNAEISGKYKRIDAHTFTAQIYKNGKSVSECKIWMGDRDGYDGGIKYSDGGGFRSNSWNESLSVKSDKYSLFLEPSGMSYFDDDKQLTNQGGAELYWEKLLAPLQR